MSSLLLQLSTNNLHKTPYTLNCFAKFATKDSGICINILQMLPTLNGPFTVECVTLRKGFYRIQGFLCGEKNCRLAGISSTTNRQFIQITLSHSKCVQSKQCAKPFNKIQFAQILRVKQQLTRHGDH